MTQKTLDDLSYEDKRTGLKYLRGGSNETTLIGGVWYDGVKPKPLAYKGELETPDMCAYCNTRHFSEDKCPKLGMTVQEYCEC